MSAKAVREHDGKLIIYSEFNNSDQLLVENPQNYVKQVKINSQADLTIELDKLDSIDWLKTHNLVCKPDMLMKRRGKSGLLLLNKNINEVREWIKSTYLNKTKVGNVEGVVDTFIIEPFIGHQQQEEYYICIQTSRDYDEILFTVEGGIDVGNVDEKASRIRIGLTEQNSQLTQDQLNELFCKVNDSYKKEMLEIFVKELYNVFCKMHFTYLEINPLVLTNNDQNKLRIYCLDLAAKIDQTAEFEVGSKWTKALYPNVSEKNYSSEMCLEFPASFGRELTPEENYIQELDSKTGASLKLTILNKKGRIWTLVAGGGASVVYSDAIAALGKEYLNELANYGEYSGAPSTSQTYEYAKTILDLMTRRYESEGNNQNNSPIEGKVLFIGGGIANFTNVAATFKGITKALREYQHDIVNNNIRIYVRRAGPNYQEGLKAIKQVGEELKIDMKVFGPDTHITAIVPMALCPEKLQKVQDQKNNDLADQNLYKDQITNAIQNFSENQNSTDSNIPLFDKDTKAIVYGMQTKAVQGMLDFDYICKRESPSVVAIVYPFGGNHLQKFYWGTKEIMVPVFSQFKDAISKFRDVSVCINFASCRSVYSTTMEMLSFNDSIKLIAIIAEGVPERYTRKLIQNANKQKVKIIGPATVGGIKPGCFKIGNTGGMMDNIVSSKLYRPGSIAYVSKSGGMSNELNHIISLKTDGVYEGVAIGGDRYPATTFMDHLIRFQNDSNCSILVLLGEVGGIEEYKVCQALKEKIITKPLVAWCIGTCASMFDNTEIQFGHAGSMANSASETALEKNRALRDAGALVPNTFEDMPSLLSNLYSEMKAQNKLIPKQEIEPPKIPIDYSWAVELGLIRKPASFMSTISDERGEELMYAGMKISDVFKENIGIGGVLSLLWFKRRLPQYFCEFIEMVLMLTADHGPAVSGAHNTIVTARAGRDLVSSLATGILTIGQRFGGALDGAAQMFSDAYDKNLSPKEFVDSMRKQNKLIMGIGHKIKSRNNPDYRVTLVKDFAKANFPSTPLLDYALQVEQITTSKKENLILNVDGAIGVLFVDLLRNSGAFSSEEAEEYIKIGTLNGLFVLGRTIGFIGHYLDQKRLKQGLYRHPWDDISYMDPSQISTFNSSQEGPSQRAFVGLEEANKANNNKF